MKSFIRFLTVIFIGLAGFARAQDREISVWMYGDGVLPVRDFAKKTGEYMSVSDRSGFDIGKKVGYASPGLGFGLELLTPVWKNITWILGANFFINPGDGKEAQSEFISMMEDSSDVQFTAGTWVNIPVMTGFRFEVTLSPLWVPYIQVKGGINISRAGFRKAVAEGSTVEETTFNFVRDFGYEAGIGLRFMHRYSIDVRYLGLGTPRYQGRRKLSEEFFSDLAAESVAILGEQRSVSVLMVTLGVQLY